MMVKQDRSLGLLILFSILTCGIYPYFFWYKLAEDMNIMCDGDGDHTTDGIVMILLFLFTFGIYPYIWYYQVANRLQHNSRRYGLDFNESGTTVLLWLILGSFIVIGPFVALYIIIKNANTIAAMYNKNNGEKAGYRSNPNNNAYSNAVNNSSYNYQNFATHSSDAEESINTQPLSYNVGSKNKINLTCKNGEFSGAVFELGVNEKITIGRDYACNIKFANTTPNLSRRHCTVEYDGNNVWLTDNGSRFGTYLMDGTKLEPMKRVRLNEGAGFYLGSRSIVFYI